MKIVVCIKRAAALGDDVELRPDGRDVDPDYLDFALNEADSYAVEEALRLRDELGGEVVVATFGDEEAQEALVGCLVMGADRAVRVWSQSVTSTDPISVARALTDVARREEPDLVLCGVQSADFAHGATGTALAAFLDLPSAVVAKKLEVDALTGRAVVHCELEGGLVDVVDIALPALVTIQTGINEPRYGTIREKMRARRAAIELVEPADDVEPAARVREMSVHENKGKRAQMLGGSQAEIAERLVELIAEVKS